MRVLELSARDFRSYREAHVALGAGVTVISGPNGAGKTNLLEALYFGCTARSCRTANDREVVRFGAQAARVVVGLRGEDGTHETSVGFMPGQPKRLRVDGAPVDRLLDSPVRPLFGVFLPDRLDLIKGPPALRRAHLDQLAGALWPAYRRCRQAYARALVQRNALLARIRSGGASSASLEVWDAQLARYGVELMCTRARAVEALAAECAAIGHRLGLDGELRLSYRPRSRARDAGELARELGAGVERDLMRGFTGHGPHRDELMIELAGRELRTFGSRGQQRVGLLALLLAERNAIAARRATMPVLLLDDVMSELDGARRRALMELLGEGGQALITAADPDQVPGLSGAQVAQVVIGQGSERLEVAA
jgi:DNA replication and repair protein RecF